MRSSMDEHLDRLAGKFANLNVQVAKGQHRARIREALDEMVLKGELGYEPETGEYWLLPEDEEEA